MTDTRPPYAPSDASFSFSRVGLEIEGREILQSLTVSVRAYRVGIVGRNGSGKSTFARLLAGLIEPTSGHIEVCGLDVFSDRKAALSHVGILFQNPDHQIIFPTVEEEMAFGLLQQGLSKQQAAETVLRVLQSYGKDHWAKLSVHQLSQGQKRLVCLMSVLAMEPKVIILDEPYSGLDIPTQIQLGRTLSRLEAMSVHISHDPSHLQDCSQVLWLEEGKLERDGNADVVLPEFEARMRAYGERDDISDIAG